MLTLQPNVFFSPFCWCRAAHAAADRLHCKFFFVASDFVCPCSSFIVRDCYRPSSTIERRPSSTKDSKIEITPHYPTADSESELFTRYNPPPTKYSLERHPTRPTTGNICVEMINLDRNLSAIRGKSNRNNYTKWSLYFWQRPSDASVQQPMHYLKSWFEGTQSQCRRSPRQLHTSLTLRCPRWYP